MKIIQCLPCLTYGGAVESAGDCCGHEQDSYRQRTEKDDSC